MSRSRDEQDDRAWYGREPARLEERRYLEEQTPGADERPAQTVQQRLRLARLIAERKQRPRAGRPTAADVAAAEEVVREMGWGESADEEDGEA